MKMIVISAVWCPSCLILKKQLKNIQQNYPEIEIEKLDYDLDEEMIKKYQVGKILPVIIAPNNARLIGEQTDFTLKNFVERNILHEK